MATYTVLPDGSKCYAGPNCLRHGKGKQTLSPDFLQKPFKEQLEEMERLKNPLATKEPKEIDESLAGLYEVYYREEMNRRVLENQLDSAKHREARARNDRDRNYYVERQQEIENEIAEAETTIDYIMKEMVPYQVEYRRRPWTRGYLVKNANGHVHKTMSCSTCTPTTQYLWLTDYSGSSEEELVNDAGQQACTVCYPSAPVEVLNRPPRLRNPDLEAERKRKADAQAAKLKKQADTLAKSITSPDGSPLKDASGWALKTVVSAENHASEIQSDMRAIEAGKYEVHNPKWVEERKEAFERIMEALAVKKGVTREELNVLMKKKFDAKHKRDWG